MITTVNTVNDLNLNTLAKTLANMEDDCLEIILNNSNEYYRIYISEDGWMYDVYDLTDVIDFIDNNSIDEDDLDGLDIIDGGVFDSDNYNFESSYQCLKHIFFN